MQIRYRRDKLHICPSCIPYDTVSWIQEINMIQASTVTPLNKPLRTTHFINGKWAAQGGRTFYDYNPFNGEVVFEVAAGGRA